MVDNAHFPSDVVQAIKASESVEEIIIDDRTYTNRAIVLPPAEPTLKAIKVNTLTALAAYRKEWYAEPLFIHVSDPTQVFLLSPAGGRHKLRDCHVNADCSAILGHGFRFGEWYDIENFIINLQAQFVDTEYRAALLNVVGNLASENVQTLADDGVTQVVEARQGIARRGSVTVPNPIELHPYRTFPEIEQPPSAFVFRLKQGRDGEMPRAALFEADGGQWQLDAIRSIAAWLEHELEGTESAGTVILA